MRILELKPEIDNDEIGEFDFAAIPDEVEEIDIDSTDTDVDYESAFYDIQEKLWKLRAEIDAILSNVNDDVNFSSVEDEVEFNDEFTDSELPKEINGDNFLPDEEIDVVDFDDVTEIDDTIEDDTIEDDTIEDDTIEDDTIETDVEYNSDFQGTIRTVAGANLVYKRKGTDGNYEELWIYNVGNDIKKETQIRRAILAGTDIMPSQRESEDGTQSSDTFTIGNVQYLNIFGLPN
jgi:hypothetical protein